jgi:Ca2+-binding RTX toxin-like protein
VVSAGSGDDRVTTGGFSNVDGGAGDDVILVGGGSIVSGGTGDDSIKITGGDTTVNFGKGDGHDVVKAYEDVTVAITGYSMDDVILTRGHGSTMVTFKGSEDSLLIDASSWTGATLTFADGDSLHIDA